MENDALLKEVTARAQQWLGEGYDAETRAEVQRLLDKEDKTDLIEAFYKDLEFGTGGLRGIMGVGTNRMNIYTVGAATQGLANYLKKEFATLPQIKVVIGHDCRNNSRKFAKISADIFSANGIKVYLFESLRPTPKCHMPFASWVARAVSYSQPRTIPKNITDTRPIGTMVPRWYHHTIRTPYPK